MPDTTFRPGPPQDAGFHAGSGGVPWLRLAYSAPAPVAERAGLTTADAAQLSSWMLRSHLHGYRKVEVEPGRGSGLADDACYALIYAPGESWASWGVMREGSELVLWHCGSGKERGRFGSVQEAVAALPILWGRASRGRDGSLPVPLRCNVIRLG